MSGQAPGTRRSARARQLSQRKVYADEDISDDEDQGASNQDHSDDYDQDTDDDELERDAAGHSAEDSEVEFDNAELDDEENYHNNDTKSPRKRTSTKVGRRARETTTFQPREVRGVRDHRLRGSKDAVRNSLYGPDASDQEPAIQHIYRWRNEAVLPSRKADRSGSGGYHRSFYHTDAKRKSEATEEWNWFPQFGHEAFQRLQGHDTIDGTTATEYLSSASSAREVVLGPYANQKLFTLESGAALDLNEPFVPRDDPDQREVRTHSRNGWLLNLGERIHETAWAPNQSGEVQYLAVTTMPIRNSTGPVEELDGQTPSAFRPQAQIKSAIQIWQVEVGDKSHIDTDQPPSLRQVICTNWGDIRCIRWCTLPRIDDPDEGLRTHLGLLAGVWGDGTVRVLSIDVPPSSATIHIRLESAAFTARPPQGVFTTVAWISSHSICAGTSDGSLAIYDIGTHLQSAQPASPAEPIIYSSLQPSYISTLTTCYPSRPHMVVTNSAFGCPSLTDLTLVSPSSGFNASNTVFGPRSRLARAVLVWHDWSQSILTCDETCVIHALPLRRFFSVSGISKVRTNLTDLAVSECHPFIATAGVGGDVTTMNILKRVVSAKTDMWVLRWFKHEWKRSNAPKLNLPPPVRESGEEPVTTDDMDVDDTAQNATEPGGKGTGMVRITEGFKAEPVHSLKPEKNDDGPSIGIHTTIFEPESAITAVAWNPNLHVGGWIAAGMGSGLLRIEDIGVDTK